MNEHFMLDYIRKFNGIMNFIRNDNSVFFNLFFHPIIHEHSCKIFYLICMAI